MKGDSFVWFKRKAERNEDYDVETHDFSQIIKQASKDRQSFKKVQLMFDKFKKSYNNDENKDAKD